MASEQVTGFLHLSTLQVEQLIGDLAPRGRDAELRDAYFLKLTNDQWDSVDAIRDAVAYLGFDPRRIIQEFLSKAKQDPIGPNDVPKEYASAGGSKFKLYEKNHAPTDLLFLITLFLERGNNITKILLKCDREMGEIIRRKAYGIHTDRRQNASVLSSSALTLARLSQAFAVATASMILKHKIPGHLKTRALVGVSTLPLIMQHTVFAGLIPETAGEGVVDDLRSIAIVLNIEMSILLAAPKEKRKLESKDVDDLASQAEQFVGAAMNKLLC